MVFLYLVLCFIFIIVLFYFVYCNARAPAYLGSPGWVYAWVTQDVTCDSVPFLGFRLLAMSGLVYYLTRSLDIYL